MKQLQEEGERVAKTKEELEEEERQRLLREQRASGGMGFLGGLIILVAAFFIAPLIMSGFDGGKDLLKKFLPPEWVNMLNGVFNTMTMDYFKKSVLDMKPEDLKSALGDFPDSFKDVVVNNRDALIKAVEDAKIPEEKIAELKNNPALARDLIMRNPKVIESLLGNAKFAEAMVNTMPATIKIKRGETEIDMPTDGVKAKLIAAIKAGDFAKHINAAELTTAINEPDAKRTLNEILTKHVVEPVFKAKGWSMADKSVVLALLNNPAQLEATIIASMNGTDKTPVGLAAAKRSANFASENKDAIAKIFGDKGLDALAALSEKGQMPNLSNLTEIFTKPEYSALADIIKARALDAKTSPEVRAGFGALKFGALLKDIDKKIDPTMTDADHKELVTATTDGVNQAAFFAKALSLNHSDVPNKTNLDLFLARVADPKFQAAAQQALSQFSATKKADNIKIDKAVAEDWKKLIQEMDFEDPAMASVLPGVTGIPQTGIDAMLAVPKIPGITEGPIDTMINNNVGKAIDARTR